MNIHQPTEDTEWSSNMGISLECQGCRQTSRYLTKPVIPKAQFCLCLNSPPTEYNNVQMDNVGYGSLPKGYCNNHHSQHLEPQKQIISQFHRPEVQSHMLPELTSGASRESDSGLSPWLPVLAGSALVCNLQIYHFTSSLTAHVLGDLHRAFCSKWPSCRRIPVRNDLGNIFSSMATS